jgi:hypothetical protein
MIRLFGSHIRDNQDWRGCGLGEKPFCTNYQHLMISSFEMGCQYFSPQGKAVYEFDRFSTDSLLFSPAIRRLTSANL